MPPTSQQRVQRHTGKLGETFRGNRGFLLTREATAYGRGHEHARRGVQLFEGDGLLTTPENHRSQTGTRHHSREERARGKGIRKTCLHNYGSSGERLPLIAFVNAAASSRQPRNPAWIQKGMSSSGVLTHPIGKIGGAHSATPALLMANEEMSNPGIVRSVFDTARATVP